MFFRETLDNFFNKEKGCLFKYLKKYKNGTIFDWIK